MTAGSGPGFLNEHMVAFAMVAFDVDNVTEPQLEFRQHCEMEYEELYQTDDCYRATYKDKKGTPYYIFEVDGPPR